MKKSFSDQDDIRKKIIGLGKNSIHKNYYPQLQQHIKKLESKQKAVEEKNAELIKTLVKLKQTQEELIKSEERLRTLYEHANDAIFVHDTDLTFIDCNSTAEKLFNIPREELIGKTPEVFSPEKQPNGRQSKEYALEKLTNALKGELQVFEWQMIDGNNTPIHSIVSLNSFKLAGKTFVQAIVRDITAMKKLERQLLTATIEAEEIERARFAKDLHDGVGPILSTIKLYFQWLAETDDEEQRKIIIEKGNKNIGEAISSLKEVSNNLSPHILTNYGLNDALRQFIDNLTHSDTIKVDIESSLNERFESNLEITLYRVIIELINNTLKYASANNVDIRLSKENHIINVEYFDDGIGFIYNENEPKTGLGLYNIRNRIQNFGGSFELYSEPGNGMKVNISVNLDKIEK